MMFKFIRKTYPFAGFLLLMGVAVFPDLPVCPVLDMPYLPPNGEHLLGTDDIGRDLVWELLYSARISIFVALGAALVATVLGALVGLSSGYLRGSWDAWLMRVADVFLLLPTLPLIIVLGASMESGLVGIVLVIGMTAWPETARVVRARVLQLSRENFIRSAEVMGAGRFYVMWAHILPNVRQVLLARGVLAAATAMVAEAGISFLGLGDPDYRSWGSMLHDAFVGGGLLNQRYGWYLPPVCCISMTVLCLTLVGQRLIERGGPLPGFQGVKGKSPLDRLNPNMNPCLAFERLSLIFQDRRQKDVCVVKDVSLRVNRGERVVILGETGSGKSMLLLAMAGLLPYGAALKGNVHFMGQALPELSEKAFRKLRAQHVAWVPQGAGQALNPLLSVRYQVAESFIVHERCGLKAGMQKAEAILARLGIPHVHKKGREYPWQYSGGMIQRVLVAMGLSRAATLVLLDEPTKGLDEQNKKAVHELLKREDQTTFLMVTHDLGFAEEFAHRIVVLLKGQVVEISTAVKFFEHPLHPYGVALLKSRPDRGMEVAISPDVNPLNPSGCPFEDRCPMAFDKCRQKPKMVSVEDRLVRCRLYDSGSSKSS